jgi:hypothetical protein
MSAVGVVLPVSCFVSVVMSMAEKPQQHVQSMLQLHVPQCDVLVLFVVHFPRCSTGSAEDVVPYPVRRCYCFSARRATKMLPLSPAVQQSDWQQAQYSSVTNIVKRRAAFCSQLCCCCRHFPNTVCAIAISNASLDSTACLLTLGDAQVFIQIQSINVAAG